MNAITNTRYATLEDTLSHQTRKSPVDPLTNYNIFVLDQTLKHNSSISFVNTSVIRSGSDYDANVSAGLFDFNDKTNTWNAGGKVSISNLINYLPNGNTQTGYSHSLYFGKTSGNFLFKANQDLADDKYTSNDFGYFTLTSSSSCACNAALMRGLAWPKRLTHHELPHRDTGARRNRRATRRRRAIGTSGSVSCTSICVHGAIPLSAPGAIRRCDWGMIRCGQGKCRSSIGRRLRNPAK